MIVEDIDTDPLWRDFRDLAAAAGLRACWSTPIVGDRGRLLGTFAMYYPTPAAPQPSDLALIDSLVRSVAAAIDRDRLDREREQALAEERALGLTFQESLLPDIPRSIGGVELVARYRTGDPEVHVGGDWFDAVEVDGGVLLVVGDVEGHDASAAALMGQLRTVVRVAAMESHPPSVILARASAYLERLGAPRLATALVVLIDLESGIARAASAGHPPALVMRRDTPWPVVDELDLEPDPPLGIGTEWEERTTRLQRRRRGPALHRRPGGDARLRHRRDHRPPQGQAGGSLSPDCTTRDVLETALELLPPGSRGDDVAVLSAVMPSRDASPQRADRWLPGHNLSVPQARAWARDWLAVSSIPEDVWDASLLAISELVTNAVRQEEDTIRVTLTAEDGSLLIEVYDKGHRTPAVIDAAVDSTGGRGLHLVATFCEDWGVREERVGKVVWARVAW